MVNDRYSAIIPGASYFTIEKQRGDDDDWFRWGGFISDKESDMQELVDYVNKNHGSVVYRVASYVPIPLKYEPL